MNSISRLRLQRTAAIFVVGALIIFPLTSLAGSIFDDDYKPPTRVEPVTPHPSPAPSSVPAPTPNPAPPAQVPNVVTPPPTPAPVAHPAAHGVPDRASRAKCRKLFEEVYATELKDHAPAARRKLAEALLAEAAKTAEVSADRFVLLTGALQAAEEGQNLRMSFSAAQKLATEFGIDELAAKTEAASKVFAGQITPAVATVGSVESLLSLSDRLVDEDDFATAGQVGAVLQRLHPSIADADLKTDVKNQIRDVALLREARDKALPLIAKLKQSPEDPALNYSVGSYFCFQRGQWEKGLPLLAKSNDAQVKDVAETELVGPAADAIVTLADHWMAIAGKLQQPDRPKTKEHATALYRKAEQDLTGLQKLAIGKKLAQIPQTTRHRRVDLLELFNPATSVVHGAWRMEDHSLACDASQFARVEFAYTPPEEYDFRISFTDVHESDFVEQACYASGHQFTLLVGTGPNTVAGFDRVDDLGANENKTAKRKDHWLISGQHYVSIVKVRRDRVEAYLDGQLITGLNTNYTNMSLSASLRLSRNDIIAIGAHGNAIRFDSAEIIEVTGEGKVLMP